MYLQGIHRSTGGACECRGYIGVQGRHGSTWVYIGVQGDTKKHRGTFEYRGIHRRTGERWDYRVIEGSTREYMRVHWDT